MARSLWLRAILLALFSGPIAIHASVDMQAA
jgi:hypothetical protein